MRRYPLKLSYTAKTAIWAGTRLKTEFGKVSEHQTVSESWELSVRDDEMATVLNGDAMGMTLAEYFEKAGYDCVSPTFGENDRFPLLVKLIDADDILSVQVHPDDAYASEIENDSGKTEMWYIVDACEGARLVYGLRDGVTREDFAVAVRERQLDKVMNYVDVKKGQTYFIPSGMLHAIGAGILIAEIQQNSDLTYRVYDFDRVGKDGKLRPLHVDKALAVTRPYSEKEISDIRFSRGEGDRDLLANSEYFKVRRLCVDGSCDVCVTRDSFVSLVCIDGEGSIRYNGEEYPVKKGESFFMPAGMGTVVLDGSMTVILSEV